ncbi:MAG: hypothetical protein OJF55_000728 [Rhodanobacteraceae bacterium]|jgi:environmental stress-induced protein Ves|nr:MAG: hypothetical protein OJF55_000728 [Rhodanobacteraceae bacterium]
MPSIVAIPRGVQRDEAWANGAGSTTVILREPDDANWRVRVSVAKVDRDGPFSELPGTRRTLLPLDAAMSLRFPDGCGLHAARLGTLQFDGSPAPYGLLPEGPTRDFNLMLRGGARGEATAHVLRDPAPLILDTSPRWLVYLDSGRAAIRIDGQPALALNPHDAALVIPEDDPARVEGAGEIILVKLYA